jgi:dTDP-4-amino-4,6-dideoxygalactose transaminase
MTTGEGGMLTTHSADAARRYESLRLHGMSKDAWKRYSAEGSWRYDILEAGFKYNMNDIGAALGLVQLKRLEDFTARRNALAALYRRRLQKPGLAFQAVAPEGDRHAYHLFVVRLSPERGTPSRERVIEALRANKIGFSVHFIPLHTMTHYRERWGWKTGDLPITERLGEELLSLPLFPSMTDADVERVGRALDEAFERP